ncbi:MULTISPECIES: Gfo/Idh/MocA family protein [Actinosynnema]|uniref:Gfo/Idh/MocA family protein n=1 Tax=Actinosynnema TaxID=40566 RepID=UPI0020A49611|nr:Gfo/Idh/MocA family oxidoreductase [Actinosynnema pretiosum]MCP2097572.1 oxidoreductase [Actinosynnema pretiosum]
MRVALVGLGWAAGAVWLPRLAALPGATVVAGVDPDPQARARFLESAPHAAAHADAGALERSRVDLVVLAVPNHLHHDLARDLLLRGFAVFVEKPVCLTSAEADSLAEAESSGGGLLLGGSAARHRADVRALYDLVPALGPIRHVDLSWVRARGVPGTPWFTTRRHAGGGALLDLGWHLLDTAIPLLGTPEPATVVGATSADFLSAGDSVAAWRGDRERAGERDVEDTARALLVTSGGVSVSLRARWASHEPRDETTIAVEGAAGTAVLRCTFGFSPNRVPEPQLVRTSAGVRTSVPVEREPVGSEYLRQLAGLPAALTDPAARGRTARESRWVVGVVERVYAREPVGVPA